MDSFQSLLAYLQSVDESWLQVINQKWSNPIFDVIFPSITDLHRDPRMLFLLIPLLIFWIWKRQMLAVKGILAIAVTIALCDVAAYRGIKTFVQRPRPPDAHVAVTVRTKRYSGPSFPSNHATNMFGVATIVAFLIPGVGPYAFTIAALIAYSRVYVGVHYPFDVIGGALLGMMIGFFVWMLARGEISRARVRQIEERVEAARRVDAEQAIARLETESSPDDRL